MPTLEVSELNVRYGAVHAVRGVNLSVKAGEVVVVLGSNGAGKSSSLRAITGLTPSTGTVVWGGKDISSLRSFQRARLGIALVPEGRRVFAPLSVEENLELGAYGAGGAERRRRIAEVYELFPRLGERKKSLSGYLSGGEQQMLAFGRALAARPQLILMDEPSMGLAPSVVDIVMDSVKAIAQTGLGILMVEQNVTAALEVADRAAIIERGKVVAEDEAQNLREQPAVLKALLGSLATD
ncbi:MAG: transporter ATP-binding protein [Subtercola sp.]|nr:transporter ATP-binding protein [Subtercola sp.]